MADPVIWWLLSGTLVALELLTGTFYLLMLGLGAAAGALAAHAGGGLATQVIAAALVALAAVAFWTWHRRRRPGDPSARSRRSVNLDIGETVQVDAWSDDGTAQVRYRGAYWTAIRPSSSPAQTGSHRVIELVGNRLLVEKI